MDLNLISKHYLQMFPVKELLPDIKKIFEDTNFDESLAIQQQILGETIQHSTVTKYPRRASYTRTFLKALITVIEKAEEEVCEDLYNAYVSLLNEKERSTEQLCYCTYFLHKMLPITLQVSKNLVTDGTTGMFVWEASHVLAEFCLDNLELIRGKKILELGAGLGLTGLGVVKYGSPSSYRFTDHHSTVLSTLAQNVKINLESTMELNNINWSVGVNCSWECTDVWINKLDWEEDNHINHCDVILAADVIYDSTIIPMFLNTVKSALKSPGAVAIVASTIRNEDTIKEFIKSIDVAGFQLDEKTIECQLAYGRATILLHTIKTRKSL